MTEELVGAGLSMAFFFIIQRSTQSLSRTAPLNEQSDLHLHCLPNQSVRIFRVITIFLYCAFLLDIVSISTILWCGKFISDMD